DRAAVETMHDAVHDGADQADQDHWSAVHGEREVRAHEEPRYHGDQDRDCHQVEREDQSKVLCPVRHSSSSPLQVQTIKSSSLLSGSVARCAAVRPAAESAAVIFLRYFQTRAASFVIAHWAPGMPTQPTITSATREAALLMVREPSRTTHAADNAHPIRAFTPTATIGTSAGETVPESRSLAMPRSTRQA